MEQSQNIPILHKKYQPLSSSLLLTASLLNHQQARKQRSPVPSPLPPSLLTANKLNLPTEAPPKLLSSIQELKHQVRRLEQQDLTKMGKENQSIDPWVTIEKTQPLAELCNKQKKMNRRKIVKGRPQMHVLLKKRKMVQAVAEQQYMSDQKIKRNHALQDILQNQLLLQLISTQNSQKDYSNTPLHRFRRSSVTLEKKAEPIYEDKWKGRGPSLRQLSVNHKRYSGVHTIQ